MGRRSGLGGLLMAVAREAERAHRKAQADHNRALKQAVADERRQAREVGKLEAQATRQAKLNYLESRQADASDRNAELAATATALQEILTHTLSVDDRIAFDSLRIKTKPARFSPPTTLSEPARKPCLADFTVGLKEPSRLGSIVPGARARHEAGVTNANANWQSALAKWELSEKQRKAQLLGLHKEYELSKQAQEQKIAARDHEVDELQRTYEAGDPDAISAYCTLVLERSEYPDEFPQEFNLAFVPDSKQLVIEYELPPPSIVPTVAEHRYVKAKDEIIEKLRKQSETKKIYQDTVAAIALRTIHEIFEADQGHHIDTVCFNGFVQTVDPATGQDVRPHLISVRTTKQSFEQVDLARVDKSVCLRNLGAQVSPRPSEAQPVRPIVDFDMVDKRFSEQSDVLSDLESRPNLMDLNPFEFEHLVANLFSQMGLESKLTRTTRDGGVDCVAYDSRPILGGKVVIQAKRYRHTVGVSAVRDLFGTMMNEGANKGILVTTSGYGPDSHDFCKDKPIELIDGGGLLYLLRQNGVQARIIFPEE